MGKVRQKLHNQEGASLLFAILVFLVCALAGAAALTTAAANAGRYSHIRQDHQDYLTVASALRLVRDDITSHTFQATHQMEKVVTTEYTTVEGETTFTTDTHFATVEDYPQYTWDAKLNSLMKDHLSKIFIYKTAAPQFNAISPGIIADTAPAFPLEIPNLELSIADDPRFEAVRMKFSIAADYTITLTAWLGDTEQYKSQMVLTPVATDDMISTVATETSTSGATTTVKETTTYTLTETVEWPVEQAVITRISFADGTDAEGGTP